MPPVLPRVNAKENSRRFLAAFSAGLLLCHIITVSRLPSFGFENAGEIGTAVNEKQQYTAVSKSSMICKNHEKDGSKNDYC